MKLYCKAVDSSRNLNRLKSTRNLPRLVWQWFTASAVASIAVMAVVTPSLADSKYTSQDGGLVVQYGTTCSTVNASGFYQFQGDVEGDLVALDCSNGGGDESFHRFTDTSGEERCYGRMSQYWGERVVTVWDVEGAVSGYSCSQIGERYEIEMDSGQQI